MRNHEGHERRYNVVSEAWYAPSVMLRRSVVDEVGFGLYDREGCTSGEMVMRWYDFGAGEVVPQLEVFIPDGMSALSTYPDLIERLAEFDGDDALPLTRERFTAILDDLGFKDATERESESGGTLSTLSVRKPLPSAQIDALRAAAARMDMDLEDGVIALALKAARIGDPRSV